MEKINFLHISTDKSPLEDDIESTSSWDSKNNLSRSSLSNLRGSSRDSLLGTSLPRSEDKTFQYTNGYLDEDQFTQIPDHFSENNDIIPPSPKAHRFGSFRCNWNQEYQKLAEQIKTLEQNEQKNSEKLKELYLSLADLASDFIFSAKQIARIIISENALPTSQKIIQPSVLPGVAGGKKYLVNSILFKFAVDSADVFGGQLNGGDWRASKAAGAELRSTMRLWACGEGEVGWNFVALIDYRGYRVFAKSWAEFEKNSLLYGSEDAGSSCRVVNLDKKLDQIMNQVGHQLNLKPHLAGREQTARITTCADIEIHKGVDQRYYALDMARLFPPEKRGIFLSSYHVPAPHLHRFLRPEFVKTNPFPLCSDAESNFLSEREKEICSLEIEKATKRLRDETIPEFAAFLDKLPLSVANSWPCNPYFDLCSIIHERGINLRHLGEIRAKLKKHHWRSILLTEMIARVFKKTLGELFRDESKKIGGRSGEEHFLKVLVDYLNLLFGKFFQRWPMDRYNEESVQYWSQILKKELISVYSANFCTIKEYENPVFQEFLSLTPIRDDAYDIELILNRFPVLFRRIQMITQIQLTENATEQFSTSTDPYWSLCPFDLSHVDQLPLRVKSFHLVDYARAKQLYINAHDSKFTYSTQKQLFQHAAIKFLSAYKVSLSPKTKMELAECLFQQAIREENQETVLGLLSDVEVLDRAFYSNNLDHPELKKKMTSIENTRKWSIYTLNIQEGHKREILCSVCDYPVLFTGGGDYRLSAWDISSPDQTIEIDTFDLTEFDGIFSLFWDSSRGLIISGTWTGKMNVLRFQKDLKKFVFVEQMETEIPNPINCFAQSGDYFVVGFENDSLLIYSYESLQSSKLVLLQTIERSFFTRPDLPSPSLLKSLQISTDFIQLKAKNLGFDSGVLHREFFRKGPCGCHGLHFESEHQLWVGYTNGSIVQYNLQTKEELILKSHESDVLQLYPLEKTITSPQLATPHLNSTTTSHSNSTTTSYSNSTTTSHSNSTTTSHSNSTTLPKKKLLFSSCKKGDVKIWDPQTQPELQSLPNHGAPVSSLAFDKSLTTILTGSETLIRIWDFSEGLAPQLVNILCEHKAKVEQIYVFSQQNRLVTTDFDGKIYSWKFGEKKTQE